ncbi:MAG: 50S ribosomal protein L25 [Candidatus Shikimatogenerans bostrichidophilus]|nr:MAG: 50S ribosomal protein L25 [Candidatus Shikimatogenerans bostrichidophilus]
MYINKKKILNIFVKKRNKKKNNKYIPCIIYNKNYNLQCNISLLEINKILKNKEYIIYLNIKNYKNKFYVLIKDIQYNILRNKIIHIDFYKIDNINLPFISYVNVKIKGNSIGVLKGAICNIPLKKIKIKTTLKNYPKNFKIDISNLDIGDKIYIKDIYKKNKNIKFLHSCNKIILSIKKNKINKEKEETTKKNENKNKK